MRRDLEQWRENGEQLLVRHKPYALRIREIQQLIEDLGIDHKTDFYSGLSIGLEIGVEIGRRIATNEIKKGARA